MHVRDYSMGGLRNSIHQALNLANNVMLRVSSSLQRTTGSTVEAWQALPEMEIPLWLDLRSALTPLTPPSHVRKIARASWEGAFFILSRCLASLCSSPSPLCWPAPPPPRGKMIPCAASGLKSRRALPASPRSPASPTLRMIPVW